MTNAARRVVWVIRLSSPEGVANVCNVILQSISFCMMVYTFAVVVRQVQRNRSPFWKASLIGVLCMVPVPLFEVSFTLANMTRQTLIPYPAYCTLICDVFLRVSCIVIAVCRFRRAKIVSTLPEHRSAQIFYAMSVMVVLAMGVNMWSDFTFRLAQTSDGRADASGGHSPSSEWLSSAVDKAISFITFLLLFVAGVATDLVFIVILVRASTAARMGGRSAETIRFRDLLKEKRFVARMVLPYVPSTAAVLIYIVAYAVNFTFLAIGFNRIAPAIEAFVFYNVTVKQTRIVTKGLSTTHMSPSANNVSTQLSTRGLMTRKDSIATKSGSVQPRSTKTASITE
ncbi:hypothetical protein RI367_002804 [Sorochytrium milnesiophthora]